MSNRPVPEQKPKEAFAVNAGQDAQLPAFAPVAERNPHTRTPQSLFLSLGNGERLIEQWNRSSHVYLIREGLVKLVYAGENGQHVTLGLRSAGWYAGAAQAILDTPSLYSVQTVGECKVSQIPAGDFFEWTTKNVKKLHQVMKSLAMDSIIQAKLHAEINSNSAAERLEHFMQERAAQDAQWKTVDPLPLLKQGELAQLLAVSPEHLCRLRAQLMNGRR
jgi:CRP-like cAMP-binding protein